MAQLDVTRQTLSKKPWYRRHKEFVEDDLFETRISITNDDSIPFPPSEMAIDFTWEYPTGQRNPMRVRLLKSQLAPNAAFQAPDWKRKVLAPGIALLKVDYRPYGQGCILRDRDGEEINPLSQVAVLTFRGVSRMELQTLAGLYFAGIAALISVVGLVLSILFR